MCSKEFSRLFGVGIEVPSDFPRISYEAIQNHCREKRSTDDKWAHHSAAWNAVAYRFRAVTEHDHGFAKAIAVHSHEDRYLQERELFGFFTSGLSTLESFAYGAYYLGAVVSPDGFPDTPHNVGIQSAARCFGANYPSESVTDAFRGVVEDALYDEWRNVRNILAHRGAPGRSIQLAIGEVATPRDDIWSIRDGIEINADTTRSRRAWLANQLECLMCELGSFVERHV